MAHHCLNKINTYRIPPIQRFLS